MDPLSIDAVSEMLDKSGLAASSVRRYKATWQQWLRWCDDQGVHPGTAQNADIDRFSGSSRVLRERIRKIPCHRSMPRPNQKGYTRCREICPLPPTLKRTWTGSSRPGAGGAKNRVWTRSPPIPSSWQSTFTCWPRRVTPTQRKRGDPSGEPVSPRGCLTPGGRDLSKKP